MIKKHLKLITIITITIILLPLLIMGIWFLFSKKKRIQIIPTFAIVDAKEEDDNFLKILNDAIQEAKKALKK